MASIKFNPEELYWIERTADIESARVLDKFTEILNAYKAEPTPTQQALLNKLTEELIASYTFLITLRAKLEHKRNSEDKEDASCVDKTDSGI